MIRSTRAVIDLDALEWNYNLIKKRAPTAQVLAMVKANGYGHGMTAISRVLQHLGADMLGVAFVSEAIELREAGITLPIVVLTPHEPQESEAVVTHSLTTVACSIAQAQHLSVAAAAQGKVAQMHLYVDTGMHRDGVHPRDVVDVVATIDSLLGIELSGILTHFATADELHDPFLKEQHQIFEQVLSTLKDKGRVFRYQHVANTGAIWQAPYSHHTLIRPGLSLHGYAVPESEEYRLRPTMSIQTTVLSVRHLWPGETVSYGRRFMAAKETRIATIPIGYGDGYLRALSGKSHCLIRGHVLPIVGTICMDECMVDVGDVPVKEGDDVIILGQQADSAGQVHSIDAVQLAEWAGTIPYEITTAVSARVPRIYVGALTAVATGNSERV